MEWRKIEWIEWRDLYCPKPCERCAEQVRFFSAPAPRVRASEVNMLNGKCSPLRGIIRSGFTRDGFIVVCEAMGRTLENSHSWQRLSAWFRAPIARWYRHDAPPYILSTPATGVSNGHVFINGAAIDGRLGGSRRYCVGDCGCPRRQRT